MSLPFLSTAPSTVSTGKPPQHVIDAIRTILGINTQRGIYRRDQRRLARQQLREYLTSIGAATPKEIERSIHFDHSNSSNSSNSSTSNQTQARNRITSITNYDK